MVAASESIESTPINPAEWKLPSRRKIGMACLIATESALFSVFVVAYLFYIGKSLTGPTPAEVLDIPVLATICLLSSSLTIVIAERAMHRGSMGQFKLWWFVTILLAAEFLGATAYEWYKLIRIDHLTIATNLFGTTYYSLVGLHGSHVIVGLILLGTVFFFGIRGYDLRPHAERIQMISWYWHFVDVVWVVVFTVVYVVGR
jgi:cytochrome c oxidase subunit 3/cytochrome o ubiquinol oxidase subunit 3